MANTKMEIKGFNKVMTAVFNKEVNGEKLTEKQQTQLDNFIKDVGGYRPEETEQTELLNDMHETIIEEKHGDDSLEGLLIEEAEKAEKEEEKKPAAKKAKKKLTLDAVQDIENTYNQLSKHEKLKSIDNSALDVRDRLKELGIYGIFEGKKAKNDIGAHYLDYDLPTLEGLDYQKAYKKLSQLYKKNPQFKKTIEENAQGEIITIAGYGGLFLNFIKPYEGNEIEIDGLEKTITIDNWHEQPIAAWSNGGRMIKVFYSLGMINYLDGNYYQKPTDKFQLEKRDIRTRHWLHFEERGNEIGLITRNGNFKTIPDNLEAGWKTLIEWAQKAI